MSIRADDSAVRGPQQPPREEPEPEEPGDACSAYRRAVTDQAERNAHSHNDGHDEERRKPEVAPRWEPPKREREQQRNKKEECRRDAGFEAVPVGLPGRVLAALIDAAAVEPEEAFEEPG